MFKQTFVEAQPQGAKSYSMLVSLLVQITILTSLLLIPLWYGQTLPNAQLKSILMTPAPPTRLAPPKQITVSNARAATMAHPLNAKQLIAPRVIPRQIAAISDAPSAPDLSSAVSDGNAASPENSLLFGSTGTGTGTIPAAAPPVKSPARPMRVGGMVAAANLTRRVEPVYPPLAKSARVSGSVEFSALISKQGNVENLQLVHGHPLLVNAARLAILQWQYRPTLLNGQAVEVLTSITVNFKLSD